jgi:hypothetical protein
MRLARTRSESRGDSGAVLIIALIFMLAMGAMIGGVATLATGDFRSSSNLAQQNTLQVNVESAATLAVDNMRYNYSAGVFDATLDTSTPDCLPGASPATFQGLTVYCWGNQSPGSTGSRVVNFYVCYSQSVSNWKGFVDPPPECSQVLLSAKVTFDDVPPDAPPEADNCTAGAPSVNTCGIVMTIDSWDVRAADS